MCLGTIMYVCVGAYDMSCRRQNAYVIMCMNMIVLWTPVLPYVRVMILALSLGTPVPRQNHYVHTNFLMVPTSVYYVLYSGSLII